MSFEIVDNNVHGSGRPVAREKLIGMATPIKYMVVAVVGDALKCVTK